MVLLASVAQASRGHADPRLAACACGPLATRRKRMAVACGCAEWALGLGADPRVRRLIEVGRRYAAGAVPAAEVEAALRAAEATAADAERRVARVAWSIFEGRRIGDAKAEAGAARTVAGGVRWALGLPGGRVPSAPHTWGVVRKALTAAAPVFDPNWRTADVLALARLVRDGGDTEVLPILADALQDAGCEDEQVLGHCRGPGPHATACWVPDLILDAD